MSKNILYWFIPKEKPAPRTFTEEQMEQAYNDGVESEVQRCGFFNIDNY